MIPVRVMFPEGENQFRQYLTQVRSDPSVTRPDLNNVQYSKEFSPQIMVDERRIFNLKLDLAKYLNSCFKDAGVKREDVVGNNGLWTWLAYLWFEQLTNARRNILKREEHYICTTPSNYQRYYIHLVAPLYIIYSQIPLPFSKLFLYNPPWEINDFTERVAANQFLISHQNIIEVIYRLYFDEQQGRPKSRATSRDVEGGVRRFIKVFQQFELTYDVYLMTPEEIIELLPQEFNSWKPTNI